MRLRRAERRFRWWFKYWRFTFSSFRARVRRRVPGDGRPLLVLSDCIATSSSTLVVVVVGVVVVVVVAVIVVVVVDCSLTATLCIHLPDSHSSPVDEDAEPDVDDAADEPDDDDVAPVLG